MFKRFFERIYEESGCVHKAFSFVIGKFSCVNVKCKQLCKRRGTAIMEAALCIPILLYLIFFIIETIRIGICQATVDNIAVKLAFEYSGKKSTSNFEKIIKRSLSPGVSSKNVYCRIYLSSDLNTLLSENKLSENPSVDSENNISPPDDSPTSGCAFVITVSYKFPFSSALIGKLFAGGKNYGNNFLLWSRVVNVCS